VAGHEEIAAGNGREMTALLLDLLDSETWRRQLAECGRATILERHTCAHRAQRLEEICHALA
ncbi:MAG: glycosyltransferase family 1 protein, partial [Rhizobiaceae bacterium]